MTGIEDGNFGEHKPCRSGVWELKIDYGAGYRVYYSIVGTTVVLLLCAGDKRTQQKNGYDLREPYSKPIGDGIFELRAQVATNISRVLYFFVVNGKAVLTHGFVKKTDKTPKTEIARAKRYREDYLRRHDAE